MVLGKDAYEAIVVGSGFGGAVAACRLARAGVDVGVLERAGVSRSQTRSKRPADAGLFESG
jgi:cholesterol oxidase